MNRIDLFRKALADCRQLMQQYPNFPPLKSVENQLQYLIDIEEGIRNDRTLLSTINIGVITAREIEDLDMSLADTLHEVNNHVRQMELET